MGARPMGLVVLLLACAQEPSFESSGLAELVCASTLEELPWETVVDGVSMEQRRDSVLGTQEFLNLNQDEFFDEIAVSLTTSQDMPVRITWHGEDCPDPELRIPLDGDWVIEGVLPTAEAVCVLDQAERVRCVGNLEHDEDLEARLREYGADGAGLFVQPPMVLDWDVLAGTAAAEVWLEFMVWDATGAGQVEFNNIVMGSLEYQAAD